MAPAAIVPSASYELVADANEIALGPVSLQPFEHASQLSDPEAKFESHPIPGEYDEKLSTLMALVGFQLVLIVALLRQFIVHRKQRNALIEAQHRFRLARIAAKVGFWQWDLASDRMIVDSELRELLGFHPPGNGPIDWRSLIHKDDLDAVLKAAREHVSGSTPVFEVQHRITDRDDHVRWFLTRGQAVLDRDNHRVRIVGTAIDITERKHEDDQHSRVQAQLQEQRSELAHLGRAAVAGALSGALAHELKQPLSAILMNAQAGQRYLTNASVSRDELQPILADIESEGRRAGSIIRNVRNMLRPGEERLVPVHIQSVVHDVLSLVRSDLLARNVQVVVAPMADLPVILGDRVQLQQVLLNLIANACDAMKNVDPRDRHVIIQGTAAGGRIHLTVSDNGCGLGDVDREDIFKPFVSTKRLGLGLGLSISRSIVEAHGGKVWAENDSRGGTTMHMEFPPPCDEPAANQPVSWGAR